MKLGTCRHGPPDAVPNRHLLGRLNLAAEQVVDEVGHKVGHRELDNGAHRSGDGELENRQIGQPERDVEQDSQHGSHPCTSWAPASVLGCLTVSALSRRLNEDRSQILRENLTATPVLQ